jgi:hypothetical protein
MEKLQKQVKKPQGTQEGEAATAEDVYQWMDRQDEYIKIEPVLLAFLAIRDPKTTLVWLKKWAADCLSPKGINEIGREGNGDCIQLLLELSAEPKTVNRVATLDSGIDYAEIPVHTAACDAIDNEVLRYVSPDEILRLKEELKQRYLSDDEPQNLLDFFSGLSVREKFLIDAFGSLCAAGCNVPGGTSIGDALSEATAYDPSDIPADLRWLQGAQEFAGLVAKA